MAHWKPVIESFGNLVTIRSLKGLAPPQRTRPELVPLALEDFKRGTSRVKLESFNRILVDTRVDTYRKSRTRNPQV